MSILIVSPGRQLDRWKKALVETDPSVPVLLPEEVKNPDDIVFALAWNQPPGLFKHYPRLKAISSFGAGVDHLMSDPHIPKEVMLTRIIDPLLSADMAEFALAVIMKHLRGFTRYSRYQRESRWKKHGYLRMKDVQVGVMGTGVIGQYVASFLHQAGLTVCGWSRTKDPKPPFEMFSGKDGLGSFLAASDILICLLPLTEATRGIINMELISQLPHGAFLINLGRGAHVVDHDLIGALNHGRLAGAHLDVFDPEPLPEDHPFWRQEGIDITPHVASLTDPLSVAPQVMDNYHRLCSGKPLKNTVSRKQGY